MRRADATRLYYALQILLSMPTWVVMAVYLVQERNLSPLQLVLMGTAMEGAVFLFEIPTGVVADTYSRRLSLIVGYVGMGVTWMLVGVVSAPWLIIALWGLWGLSYTFTSGAEEAWIADEVGADKVGPGLPARCAGLVRRRGPRPGAAGCDRDRVAARGRDRRRGDHRPGRTRSACCSCPRPVSSGSPAPSAGRRVSELRTTAATGARYAWAAPVILLLIGVQLLHGHVRRGVRPAEGGALPAGRRPARVGDLDPVVWFGIFWLVGAAARFVATGWLIKRFERGGRRVVTSSLFTLTAMEMVAMLVFALTGSTWLAIASLLGVFFARDLAGPLYTIWLNEQIKDSSVRATVLSISGQANAIGQAGGGPVLGAIGNVWGIRVALAVGAS